MGAISADKCASSVWAKDDMEKIDRKTRKNGKARETAWIASSEIVGVRKQGEYALLFEPFALNSWSVRDNTKCDLMLPFCHTRQISPVIKSEQEIR
jgi:hypothetical protein